MGENKEFFNGTFRLRDENHNILIEDDDPISFFRKLEDLIENESDQEEACHKECEGNCDNCTCHEKKPDDEHDDDVMNDNEEWLDDDFRTVNLLDITVTPLDLLKIAGVIGGLIGLRRILKHWKS